MEDLIGKLFVEANIEYITENSPTVSKKGVVAKIRKFVRKIRS